MAVPCVKLWPVGHLALLLNKCLAGAILTKRIEKFGNGPLLVPPVVHENLKVASAELNSIDPKLIVQVSIFYGTTKDGPKRGCATCIFLSKNHHATISSIEEESYSEGPTRRADPGRDLSIQKNQCRRVSQSSFLTTEYG